MYSKKKKTAQQSTKIPIWFPLTVTTIVLLVWFGSFFAVQYVYDSSTRSSKEWQEIGPIGDIFGAATSLFSALTLIGVVLTLWQQQKSLRYQLQELRDSVTAQEEMARSQSAALAAEVLLPLMTENRSKDQGRARAILSGHCHQKKGMAVFSEWHRAVRSSEDLDFQTREKYNELQWARREIKELVVKVYSLREKRIIPDDELPKMVLSGSTIELLRDTVLPMEQAIDPMQHGVDWGPKWLIWALQLYSEDDANTASWAKLAESEKPKLPD